MLGCCDWEYVKIFLNLSQFFESEQYGFSDSRNSFARCAFFFHYGTARIGYMAGRPWEKYLRENNEVAEKLAENMPSNAKNSQGRGRE